MPDKCRLYYDARCPICTNYVTVLKRKLSSTDVIFTPTTENMDDFKFSDENGNIYTGKDAIEKMAIRFPVLLDYFWMLPEKFRVDGLKAAYKVGSMARQVIKKVSGCGCGK